MDISIIISGNLTGFSRFYASPNANDIYSEAKFDFDYRNFLTFINAGEKAYAISFSPKVIAVSLITRILDSFRRPGILVVTALIPRYQLVSGTLNIQDKSAIYRLLNEINDKFYEKNFLNGMVNQNPAVLMQDYYSDILRNYALVSDRMQKAINTTIEVNSPNRRIGYISTSEIDMPKYLSSLMRKSYNGYHHVFFADKAPTNIDEPADEIVTYKVRVTNDNRPIHGEIRLDDRIPNVSPQQGEMPIPNQNYTYRQVLNGDTGNEIIASLENDTIVLTYRFQQEEKTINFKFYDGANEVPLHLIRPVIVESNGSSYPLSTDRWTFRGKEIYGLKTIKSNSPEYTVEPSSSHIDIQRLPQGATHNVYIGKGWIWNFNPIDTRTRRPVTIQPVDIVLENRITGEYRNFSRVTGAISERMSGNESDWIMKITSDYYEPITSLPNGGGYSFKRKQQQPVHGGNNQFTDVQRGGSQTKTHGHSTSNKDLKLSGGQNETAKETGRFKEEQRKRYIQYGIFSLVAILCCIGVYFTYDLLKGKKENLETKPVLFAFVGNDNIEIKDTKLLNLLDFNLASSNVKITDTGEPYRKDLSYKKNEEYSIDAVVLLKDVPEEVVVVLFDKTIPSSEITDPYKIVLSVSEDDLLCYSSLLNNNLPESNSFNKLVQSLKDRNELKFANLLLSMYNPLKQQDDVRRQEESERLAQERTEQKRVEEERKREESKKKVDWTRLDRVDVTLSTIAEVTAEANQKGVTIPSVYQTRMEKLPDMIGALRRGERPTARKGELSDAQIKKIQEIWRNKENDHYVKYKGQFRNVSSLTEFSKIIKSRNIQ